MDFFADTLDDLQIIIFHFFSVDFRIGCHEIEVQLQRISARFFDLAGIAGPAAVRDAVQTADDRNANAFLGFTDTLKVFRFAQIYSYPGRGNRSMLLHKILYLFPGNN